MDNKESRGLGDTVAKITKATGIDKIVKFIAGEDCGCDERKKKLNELFQYRWKVKCLNEDQFKTLHEFFRLKRKEIKPSEQRNFNEIHKEVFGFEEGTCDGCVRSMVNRLRTVYDEYLVKEEEKMIDNSAKSPEDEVYEKPTLKELRAEYPHIKATSVEVFLQKLEAEKK